MEVGSIYGSCLCTLKVVFHTSIVLILWPVSQNYIRLIGWNFHRTNLTQFWNTGWGQCLYTVLLRINLILWTCSERVPKRVQNAFGTPSRTRSEHLPEYVRNTFLNTFRTPSRTRYWMRCETRVISLWSFESLRKIPNTINDNTVNPNSSNSHYQTLKKRKYIWSWTNMAK
jgi:hypothetical protein